MKKTNDLKKLLKTDTIATLIVSFIALILACSSICVGGTYLMICGDGEIGNYVGGAFLYLLAILFGTPFVIFIIDDIKEIKNGKS